MKANELMIGDWVHYRVDLGKDGFYEKDIQINNIYGCDVNCKLEYEEIISGTPLYYCYPIPLTPEILEKNGFEKCDGNEWSVFKYKDDDCTKNALYQLLWSADELYLEISSYTSNTGEFNRIGIRYVHELQHALKLCGIDKIIEL